MSDKRVDPSQILAKLGVRKNAVKGSKDIVEFVKMLNDTSKTKWVYIPKSIASLEYDFIAHYNKAKLAWGLILLGETGTPYEPASNILTQYEQAEKDGENYIITVPGVAIDSYAKENIVEYLISQGVFESADGLNYHQGIALYAGAELDEDLAIQLDTYLHNWASVLDALSTEKASMRDFMKSLVDTRHNFAIYPSIVPGRTMSLATGDKIGVHFSLKFVASSKTRKKYSSQEDDGTIELCTVSGIIDIIPDVDVNLDAEVLCPELSITSVVSNIPTAHAMIWAVKAVQEFATAGFWANTLIEHASTSTSTDQYNPGALNRLARRYKRVKEGKKTVLVLEDIPEKIPEVPDMDYPALDLTGAKSVAEKTEAIERLLELVPGRPKISIECAALSPDSDPTLVFDVIASDDEAIRAEAKKQLATAYSDICGALPKSTPDAGTCPANILAVGRNKLPRGFDTKGRSTQDFGLIRIVQAYSKSSIDLEELDNILVNYIRAKNRPSSSINLDLLKTYSLIDASVTGLSNRVLLHGDFVKAIMNDFSPLRVYIAGDNIKRRNRKSLGIIASELGVSDASF